MSQHFEASSGATGKLACLFLPAASHGRRVAKPAMAPFTSNWSILTVFLNSGCSTTARYLKSGDRSFALNRSTFWPWFRSPERFARRHRPCLVRNCARRDDTVIRSSQQSPVDVSALLHAQRDEAQFAFAVRYQQQHRLLAVLLELVDALLDVGRVSDRFLRHLDDDVAGGEPLF